MTAISSPWRLENTTSRVLIEYNILTFYVLYNVNTQYPLTPNITIEIRKHHIATRRLLINCNEKEYMNIVMLKNYYFFSSLNKMRAIPCFELGIK